MDQRPIVELLRRGKFPEIAAALRVRAPQVLENWERLVRDSLPSAARLTFEQLRDDMPVILEKIAKSIESDEPGRTRDLLSAVPVHGSVRFHQSFSLAETLAEYDLLRAVVMDQVVSHLGRKIEADEVVTLNGAVDLAGRRAVLAYVEFQTHELQAANEAQSKYLSFLSHDLRGGLNGVFLMIEVLKRELAGQSHLSETVEDLDTMRRSLLETVATMDRFLHAERFRKGKVDVKPGRIHLKPLLNEVSSHYAYQAKEKGLELRVDAPADLAAVSDRELLALIIQNLVSNSIKYTPTGAVAVSARADDGDSIVVSVRDEGPGIPADLIPTLFADFTRGQTHGQPGVGLGLSIARQAAGLIGAKLWVESTPGDGATFFVRIPKEMPARS
jgi:signal transduction histidine kinase